MMPLIDMQLRLSREDWTLTAEQQFASPGFWLLSGISGAGKTTLLRILAGLEPSATGHLRVGNAHWLGTQGHLPANNRRVGYVNQAATVFTHMSVQENLRFASGQQDQTALQQMLISVLALQGLQQRSAQRLSGGERQRLALAMALSRQPQWLLLDEPTNAIDQQARLTTLHCLRALQHEWQIPILMVSHQVTELEPFIDDHFQMVAGHWQR